MRGTDLSLLFFNAANKRGFDPVIAYKQYFDKIQCDRMKLKLVGVVPSGVSDEKVNFNMLKVKASLLGLDLDVVVVD